jgi:hypothetical protein
MSSPASPATRFHDVEVANDQTGAVWHAPVAFIRNGMIFVSGQPPRGFLDTPGSTFTISAADIGGRKRRFPLVTFDRAASMPPTDFAFN